VRLDHHRRVLQPLGGLELALGVDHLRAPLALGLGLPGHRALHALRDLDVLDLDDRDLDAPGRGLLVDDRLQDRVDLLALRQQLVELMLAEHRPQRRLRDLRRRDHEVLDLHDRGLLRIDDPEVATAFTRTGTLSLVITSCGGMFSVIVRRSTKITWSTNGIRRKRPGPRGSGKRRPSRKTMQRWYSRGIRTAITSPITNRKSTTRTTIRTAATA
jgi:hypothetical protein